jgi:hypothetical protein
MGAGEIPPFCYYDVCMSYELIGIIILGVMGVGHMGGLVYLGRSLHELNRSFEEQLRRNMALQTQFQRWNAEKLDNITQRLDQVLEMLQKREI